MQIHQCNMELCVVMVLSCIDAEVSLAVDVSVQTPGRAAWHAPTPMYTNKGGIKTKESCVGSKSEQHNPQA